MKILVTGGAGFIGSHLVQKLLQEGHDVTVVDNFDSFYPRQAKEENVRCYAPHSCLRFIEGDLSDSSTYNLLPSELDCIVHLAAKAGVRPSIEAPMDYVNANLVATQLMLEYAVRTGTKQFVFASSSSVYGLCENAPWREDDGNLKPISPYAATKLSNEYMGHVYSNVYNLRFVGLRFFTVYGPRQRPDLAINKFVNQIKRGEVVRLFGDGSTLRDYTFIDDIVDGVYRAMYYEGSRFRIFNLGCGNPVKLLDIVKIIEDNLGIPAIIEFAEEQSGDVPLTWASVERARSELGYHPVVSISEGISKYIRWIKVGY